MDITFNEASHFQKVSSLEEAAGIYREFLNTYTTLEKVKRITNNISFYGNVVDISAPITCNGETIYDLQKMWGNRGKTECSKLLSIFSKFASRKRSPVPCKKFILDGICFLIPEDDHNTILISLLTLPKYTEPYLEGNIEDGSPLPIKNISRPTHIEEHRVKLGIRCYQRNPKHKPIYTSMGNGRQASPMDLSDQEAQEILNTAISIDTERVLYAVKENKCYVFREHEPGKAIYHGYLDEDPPENVKKNWGSNNSNRH